MTPRQEKFSYTDRRDITEILLKVSLNTIKGQLFFLGTSVSSTNKADSHDIS
jgi:hypothetical protein